MELISRSRGFLFLLVVLLALSSRVLGQVSDNEVANAENVRFELSGDQVSIHYDLAGSADDRYHVTVTLRRESDSSFSHSLVKTSGDVGIGLSSGMNKRIIWNLREEFPEGLPGEDFYFVVTADRISSQSPRLLWIGAGVAVLGGVATYLLLKNHATAESGVAGFPAPPGRP